MKPEPPCRLRCGLVLTDIEQMKRFLQSERTEGTRVHLTFEISGRAGYRYDQLCGYAEDITVSNPSKMTWIHRTAKKTDRIDACKEGPSVVRWLVTEASWRAIKKSPCLRAFYERVRCGQKGRKNIAIVAVARKLLRRVRIGV